MDSLTKIFRTLKILYGRLRTPGGLFVPAAGGRRAGHGWSGRFVGRLMTMVLVALTVGLPLHAQFARKYNKMTLFRVRVLDAVDGNDLFAAKVSVYDKDSTTVMVDRLWFDQKLKGYTTPAFRCHLKPQDAYVLSVSMEGYKPQTIRITMPPTPEGSTHVKAYEADVVRLEWEVLAGDTATGDNMLGEAVVTASRIAMVVHGDTIIYDARAFRLSNGSMLDALVKMLPGVTLESNGRIYVNGEYVSELMVNGRDFFKGNPKVALDNLPAYVVDKIRTYHKGVEWSHLIDEENPDDSKKSLVMDVQLRRDLAEGWIANAEAGGGPTTRDRVKDVWMGRLFGMRYTNHSSLSLYAQANNLGDTQRPGSEGTWGQTTTTVGEKIVRRGGIDFSIDGRRKGTKFRTSLSGGHDNGLYTEEKTQLTLLGETQVKDLTRQRQRESTSELYWTGYVAISPDKAYLKVEPTLSFVRKRNHEMNEILQLNNTTSTNIDSLFQPVYERYRFTHGNEDEWTAKISTQFVIRGPLSDKNYSLAAEATYKRSTPYETESDSIATTQKAEHILRNDNVTNEFYDYQFKLSRQVHSWEWADASFRLNLAYRLNGSGERGRRERLTDTLNLLTPGADEEMTAQEWAIDQLNSYRSSERALTNSIDPTLYAWFGGMKLTLQAGLDWHKRHISDTRSASGNSLTRRDFTFIPIVSLLGNGWTIFYMRNEILPSMTQMMDFDDGSDPYYITKGNSNLRLARAHYITFHFGRSRQKRQRNLNLDASFTTYKDEVTSASYYNSLTGVITRQPENINGHWNSAVELNYGQSLDSKNRWRLDVQSKLDLNHSVYYALTITSSSTQTETEVVESTTYKAATMNYKWREYASLVFKATSGITLTARAQMDYLKQRSSGSNVTPWSNETFDVSGGLDASISITKRLFFTTSCTAFFRRGYTDASMNTTQWLWNATCDYTFDRDSRWTVRLVGYDLLGQVPNTQRELNSTGYIETRYNTKPSYVSLHLIYRFNKKPKQRQ